MTGSKVSKAYRRDGDETEVHRVEETPVFPDGEDGGSEGQVGCQEYQDDSYRNRRVVQGVLRLVMGDTGWGAGAGLELVVLAGCLVTTLGPPDEGDLRRSVVGTVAANTGIISNIKTFLEISRNF